MAKKQNERKLAQALRRKMKLRWQCDRSRALKQLNMRDLEVHEKVPDKEQALEELAVGNIFGMVGTCPNGELDKTPWIGKIAGIYQATIHVHWLNQEISDQDNPLSPYTWKRRGDKWKNIYPFSLIRSIYAPNLEWEMTLTGTVSNPIPVWHPTEDQMQELSMDHTAALLLHKADEPKEKEIWKETRDHGKKRKGPDFGKPKKEPKAKRSRHGKGPKDQIPKNNRLILQYIEGNQMANEYIGKSYHLLSPRGKRYVTRQATEGLNTNIDTNNLVPNTAEVSIRRSTVPSARKTNMAYLRIASSPTTKRRAGGRRSSNTMANV